MGRPSKSSFCCAALVRFWHKADIRHVCCLSAFGGKADIGFMSPLEKRIKNRWDNFKITLWNSVGVSDEVGHVKHLKLHFHLMPPPGHQLKVQTIYQTCRVGLSTAGGAGLSGTIVVPLAARPRTSTRAL